MTPSSAYTRAVVSGALLALAYPPIGLGFLAFIAVVPLFGILRESGFRRTFWYTWVSGLVFLGISLSWIRHITWAGMVLAVLVLAIFYALPFAMSALMMKRSEALGLALLPFATAGVEWLRSFGQLAFPWMIFGNSMTAYPFLIQFADLTSAFGVSAWVIAVNIAVWLFIRRRTLLRAAFPVLLFAVPAVYSYVVMRTPDPAVEPLRVALIQGNVSPEEKWGAGMEEWNINLYRSMSIESLRSKPQMIIWPETAVPVYLADVPMYDRKVQSMVDSTGVPVLTGMPSIDWETYMTWNAAGLFLPGEQAPERYKKIHLVPFGEAFPLDEIFPDLRKINFGQANWDEGTETMVFHPPGLPPFNTVICFESIFPDLVRKFVIKGSQFIVVITNDVWFGPYASPIQHAMISVMRAIEFHRPVVRCANTGISMIIDARGRILKRTGTFERTTLTGEIMPDTRMSFYARHGNLFSMFSVLVSAAAMVYVAAGLKRAGKGSL